jgi:hypothetical protein
MATERIRSDSEADPSTPEADTIRAIERQRLRALVEANMNIADQLHADDFQLIDPGGGVSSKAEYLGRIASGFLKYVVWEAEAIAVRICGEMAVIRYHSRLAISVGGAEAELQRYWHMDTYEKRSGRWQVVWSQATRIQ